VVAWTIIATPLPNMDTPRSDTANVYPNTATTQPDATTPHSDVATPHQDTVTGYSEKPFSKQKDPVQHSNMAARDQRRYSPEQNVLSQRVRQSNLDPDEILPAANPFATPRGQTPATDSPATSVPVSRNASRPPSTKEVDTARTSGAEVGPKKLRFFHSRRIKKEHAVRPWLQDKDPMEKWVTIIPIIGLVVGLGLAGFLVWDGLRSVVHHKYCTILDEDFSSGLRSNIWTKEVEVGGFG
jgi:hypothetical protein